MNVKDIRRENMRMLAKELGSISNLARHLGKSQSQVSNLIGITPRKGIGDKLAAEIEEVFNKPHGWLDMPQFGVREPMSSYTAETIPEHFIHTAPLITWQSAAKWVSSEIPHKVVSYQEHIPVFSESGPRAFALAVQNDDMVDTGHPRESFYQGEILIIDPDMQAEPNSFVIAQATNLGLPTFCRANTLNETASILGVVIGKYVKLA